MTPEQEATQAIQVRPSDIVTGPCPTPDQTMIHVIGCRPGIPLRVIPVARAVTGVWTHWSPIQGNPSRYHTRPHFEPKERCPGCVEQEQMPRWRGYLPAWLIGSERCVIVEVTLHAVHSCGALSSDSGLDLRGRPVIFSRIGRNANSPCKAEMVGDRVAPGQRPEEFSPLPTLCRMWNLKPDALKRHKRNQREYSVNGS